MPHTWRKLINRNCLLSACITFLTTIFLLPSNASGMGLGVSCGTLARVILENISNRFQKNSKTVQEQHPLTTGLFGVVAERTGKYGGKRVEVTRRLGWSDPREDLPNGADLTQDLRLYPDLLGEAEARFFGFEILGHWRGVFPDINEINGAIDRFNHTLNPEDPTFITLRPKITNRVQNSLTQYLTDFANEGSIPHFRSGREFWHDLSTHSLSGLHVHPEILKIMRLRVRFILHLIEVLKTKEGSGPLVDDLKRVRSLLASCSLAVDNLGAEVAFYFPVATREKLHSLNKIDLLFMPKNEHFSVYRGNTTPTIVDQKTAIVYRNRFYGPNFLEWILRELGETQNRGVQKIFEDYAKKNPEILEELNFNPNEDFMSLFELNQKNGILQPSDLLKYQVSTPFGLRLNRLKTLSEG